MLKITRTLAKSLYLSRLANIITCDIKRLGSSRSFATINITHYNLKCNNYSSRKKLTNNIHTMTPMVLAYYDIRGLAQPIRLLLEHVNANWTDKHYITGPGPDYDKALWWHDKANLGLPFPNLPYLIDGELKLVQSGAIIRYIARKHDLMGRSFEEQTRVDLVEGQINDFRSAFSELCYSPNFEEMRPSYLEALPGKLQQFSEYLEDGKFFAGDNVTFVDFIVYEMLDQHKILEANCLNKFPNLQNFVKNVESLERVAAYLKSDRSIKDRLNNRMALFGSGV